MTETKLNYTRIVEKGTPEFSYLLVSIEFGDEATPMVDPPQLKSCIINALRQMFGDCSSSINVDILKYDETTQEMTLRVPSRGLVKLRSALTFCNTFRGSACAFHVRRVSNHLLSLAQNSRNFVHKFHT